MLSPWRDSVATRSLAEPSRRWMRWLAKRNGLLQRLHERLPSDSVDDELGHLARVFNRTLARLEQSFEQLRRFTSDASHELRTPLTLIRSVGEVGLQQEGTTEDYREIIGSMLEEGTRLTRLLDSLLTISRADAGQIALQRTTVRVLDLVRETVSLFEVLAEEKALHLVVEADHSRISVEADRILLRQALVNILHNAIKYRRWEASSASV